MPTAVARAPAASPARTAGDEVCRTIERPSSMVRTDGRENLAGAYRAVQVAPPSVVRNPRPLAGLTVASVALAASTDTRSSLVGAVATCHPDAERRSTNPRDPTNQATSPLTAAPAHRERSAVYSVRQVRPPS